MRPVNIYILTRMEDSKIQGQLERQMSRRNKNLKIKDWEMNGLRKFCDALSVRMEESQDLCFFYSFVMPKLGKEFDLLRISENSIVNVELKSGNISEEDMRKQLVQNRYYLSMLGKDIYSYTFISNENRLVKLSNSDRIVEADWEQLISNLKAQWNCYQGDIENLFKEEQYLISPLTDPKHFLRHEYFLTSQQHDIKRRILRTIAQQTQSYQGFTGLPGTGKSILLYDIAMELSRKKKIAVIHLGGMIPELEVLNERLKRVDFYYFSTEEEIRLSDKYGAILIDEGHWITPCNIKGLLSYAETMKIPVIISYDKEEVLAEQERSTKGIQQIEELPGFIRYQLTNRIRVNSELSSFLSQMMKNEKGLSTYSHRVFYPSVQIAYAGTVREAHAILSYFKKCGFQYIRDERIHGQEMEHYAITKNRMTGTAAQEVSAMIAKFLEYDRVVMLIDDTFVYDEKSFLRSTMQNNWKNSKEESPVRCLYHGLSRAKKEVALVVLGNPLVFQRLMNIVQRPQE